MSRSSHPIQKFCRRWALSLVLLLFCVYCVWEGSYLREWCGIAVVCFVILLSSSGVRPWCMPLCVCDWFFCVVFFFVRVFFFFYLPTGDGDWKSAYFAYPECLVECGIETTCNTTRQSFFFFLEGKHQIKRRQESSGIASPVSLFSPLTKIRRFLFGNFQYEFWQGKDTL